MLAVVALAVASCSPTPSPSALAVQVQGWTAACSAVAEDDCRGVAALFVNNLASSGQSAFEASAGQLTVTARSACPTVLPEWADPAACWQAAARTTTGPVCTVIARHSQADGAASAFGQVGGDEMSGQAVGPPAGWPVCD